MPPISRTAAVALLLCSAGFPQNSNRKIRPEPGPVAARAGTAVQWRDDLDAALVEAEKSGKPVFWYVPTVGRSPMDRTPEIDRYMMAGPFSWPSTIALLNEHFVPLKQVARGDAQQKYELLRQRFIEPGYLVLAGDGAEKARLDRITTFHPEWFEAPLRALVGLNVQGLKELANPELRAAWGAYQIADLETVEQVLKTELKGGQLAPAAQAEARFLLGAAYDRSGRSHDAVTTWNGLVQTMPEQPWAWKAAAEAEGHGPFARGFEDFLELGPGREPSGQGSRAAAGVYDEAQLWQRSVRFLLAMDRGDGSYTDSWYDFGGTDSMPNVHAAVTALVGEALLEVRRRHEEKKLELDAATRSRLEQTLARILGSSTDRGKLNPLDRDEILWAHAYRIRLLARWVELDPKRAAELLPKLQGAVDALQGMQPDNGAWYHEYPNPFAIATALTALHRAERSGARVDQEAIARGVRALLSCRAKNGGYTYGFRRRGRSGEPRVNLPGAAGRMPRCELALLLWGHSDEQKLSAALGTAFEYHDVMAAVRKYDDHADRNGYGGFFFWYDMRGRTEAVIALTEDGEQRQQWVARQRELILTLPEFDGCFVDSHELGRVYGTAMALLCLAAS